MQPAEPAQTTQSAPPAQPIQPAQLGQPAPPAPPGQPVQPAQPALGQPVQPAPPGLAEPVTPAQSRRLARLALRSSRLILLALVVGCVAGLVTTFIGLTHWYGTGRPLDVLLVGLLAMAIVAAHALSIVWAYLTVATRREVLITQAPYPPIYVLALIWGIAQPFAPGYVGWVAAVLVAIAWLTVWYLRDARQPRRAIAYLATLGVLAAGSGGGAVLIGWRQTNGYGLVGQRTPWAALYALTVTSCLSTETFYPSGTQSVHANCSGAQATSGAYDEGAFANQLCTEQPRAAFEVWWERARRYQVVVTLDFGYSPSWQVAVDGQPVPTRPESISGDTASITLTMRVTSAFRPGEVPAEQKHPMRLDKDSEMWNVTAKRSALGGWKVCAIDIPDPIQASAAPA